MAYNVWDSCLLVSGVTRADCFAAVQAGAGVLQFLGAIGAMALTLVIWRRSSVDGLTKASNAASVFAVQLIEVLAEMRRAAETQQVDLFAKHAVTLAELHDFSRSIRVDLLPEQSVYEFFKLRALAARASSIAPLVVSMARSMPAAQSDFDILGRDAVYTAQSFEKDMKLSRGSKRTNEPTGWTAGLGPKD